MFFRKQIFYPYVKNFAYNSSFSGAAFVINSGYIGYQHGLKDFVVNTFTDAPAQADSINRLSKAVEQVIFEDYRLKQKNTGIKKTVSDYETVYYACLIAY